jgi:murein DD-endopeptidase MepM/ murein hydrolase activator NlpD
MVGCILLGGCLAAGAQAQEGYAWYRVRPGDNLSLIAQRLGVTLSELVRANGLTTDVIHPGQRLQIERPLHRKRAHDIRWRCPLRRAGRTLRGYGTYHGRSGTLRHTGIDMATPAGQTVVSPATGVVRYLGKHDGFGLLVILAHGADYASVLAPLDPGSMAVEVGEVVLGGTEIGRVGEPVEHQQPYLHVELRRRNEAIDPSRLRH